MKYKYTVALLFLTGCAPAIRFPDWDASTSDARVDASGDRAEVLAVDVPRADVVVLRVDGAADVVWVNDRPDASDVLDVGAADAAVPADATDAPVDALDAPAAPDVTGPCPALQDRCDGACVPLLTTAEHCGACGRVCPSTATGVGVCNGGRCEVACREGYADCGRGCQATASDRQNCGGCGFVCGTRETCVAGNCAPCAAGESVCDGRCVRMDTTDHCGSCSHRCPLGAACARGTTCEYTSCAAGRDAGTWTVCPDGCVDVRSDDQNCLGCGNACPLGTRCLGGVCG